MYKIVCVHKDEEVVHRSHGVHVGEGCTFAVHEEWGSPTEEVKEKVAGGQEREGENNQRQP